MIKDTDTWIVEYNECHQCVVITHKPKRIRIEVQGTGRTDERVGDVMTLIRNLTAPDGVDIHYTLRASQPLTAAFGAWLQNEIYRKN
jgi:hypothetical protein